jgi:hypothetical protein
MDTTLLPMEPQQLLLVHDDVLALKEQTEPAIAEARRAAASGRKRSRISGASATGSRVSVRDAPPCARGGAA